MSRPRVNPFAVGTPERLIYDRYRKSNDAALAAEKAAALAMTEAKAYRSSAERYAEALRALGHGDKVPGQAALPNYAQLGGGHA
ncbi:MAG: hypothetical protein QM690_17175 [Sphingobium sp.]